jgi:hypothetical protein
MATIVIRPTGKTSDEITKKARNETRQVRTHTWAPGTSPKPKSLQDLSIRVNPKVTQRGHASCWSVSRWRLASPFAHVQSNPLSLESSDPFHRVLSLVNPITDVPLQRSIVVRLPSRDGGSGSKGRLGVTARGVVTTLMVTRVATPVPSVPLGLLRVSL